MSQVLIQVSDKGEENREVLSHPAFHGKGHCPSACFRQGGGTSDYCLPLPPPRELSGTQERGVLEGDFLLLLNF